MGAESHPRTLANDPCRDQRLFDALRAGQRVAREPRREARLLREAHTRRGVTPDNVVRITQRSSGVERVLERRLNPGQTSRRL